VDWEHTRLWDGASVRNGWLQLERPQPATRDRLAQLASRFEESACGNPVLREAVTSYLKAASPVEHPIHYPRKCKPRVTESYEWFVENERTKGRLISEGWALPHVRDDEPRLPYFGDTPEASGQGSKQGRKGRRR